MRWPISLAKILGDITADYRWFAGMYLAVMFVLAPLIVFALSFLGGMKVIIFIAIFYYNFLLQFFIAILLQFIAFFKLQLLQVMYCVLGPLITLAAVVILINVIQNHRSHWLPHCLRDWSFLPVWMRSLQPLDDLFSQFSCCSKCMTPPMDQIQEDFKDIEAAIALNANAEEMENFVNANGRKPKIIVA